MPSIINGPWVAPSRRNVQYVLRWMGFLASDEEVNIAARELYERKRWAGPEGPFSVRIACFGGRRSDAPGMRDVLERTHLESVKFIVERFQKFNAEKADQRQWDAFIKKLFDMSWKNAPPQRIMEWIDRNG